MFQSTSKIFQILILPQDNKKDMHPFYDRLQKSTIRLVKLLLLFQPCPVGPFRPFVSKILSHNKSSHVKKHTQSKSERNGGLGGTVQINQDRKK